MIKYVFSIITVIILVHSACYSAPIIGCAEKLNKILVSCKISGNEGYLHVIARPEFREKPNIRDRWPRSEIRIPEYGYITEVSNMGAMSYSDLFATTQKIPNPDGIIELRVFISNEITGEIYINFPISENYSAKQYVRIDMNSICPNGGQGRQYDLLILDRCLRSKSGEDCYKISRVGY